MKAYSFFDSREFLGQKENSPHLYAHASKGLVYIPFSLDLDQWRRLLLVDFAGDSKYHAIELLVLHNEFSQGAVVVLYNKDGNVDGYYSRNLSNFMGTSLEKLHWAENYNLIGEADIDYLFEISEKGVDTYLKMTDQYGAVIEVRVKENHPKKEFQDLLAALDFLKNNNPEFFPFMYLHKFSFVTYQGTEFRIMINGEERTPLMLPIKRMGEDLYHSRYSDDPCLGYLNRNFRGILKHVEIEDNKCKVNNTTHTFIENAGHYELSQMSCASDKHKVYFQFSPPVPDLVCLREDARIQGRFAVGIDGRSGVLGWEYNVERNVDKIRIAADPIIGFHPPGPGPVWFKTYGWIADIKISKDEVSMESNWIRRKLIVADL